MKKITLLIALTLSITAFSQVDRQKVIVEVSTGTWCPSCPAVVSLLENLKASGAEITVLKYHINDNYENTYSVARDAFYDFGWYPASYYDGELIPIDFWANYNYHAGVYQDRIDTQSSFTSSMDYTIGEGSSNISGTVSLERIASYPGTNLRLHIVLTESKIPEVWQGLTELNNVVRLMNGDGLGEVVDFSSSSTLSIPFSFDLNPAWNTEELEIAFFIQDHDTKEILQGDYLEVENTLGNSEIENNTIQIVPNPATNFLKLITNGNDVIANIQIFDLLGKNVLILKTYQDQINISSLEQGIYLVTFELDGVSKVSKFIKE